MNFWPHPENNMELELINQPINAVELFTGDNLPELLDKIESQAIIVVPDTSTSKSRQSIASLAHKIASSKVLIDDAGKKLVAEWKTKAKVVDAVRKTTRERLDSLKEKIRQPLTDWEASEKLRKQKEQEFKDWDEALELDDLFNQKREVAKKIAEIEEKEHKERMAKLIAEKKIKRQQEIKEAAGLAAEQARKDAEEHHLRELAEAQKREHEAKERAIKFELELERQKTIKKETDNAGIAVVCRKPPATDGRKKAIRLGIVKAMMTYEIQASLIKKIVDLIDSGQIPHVFIDYTNKE